MSVPFSSDEFLLKRSLFSSIFGVANRLKQAKTATAAAGSLSTAAEQQFFDESRQPCSSCQILDQQREVDHLYVHNGSSSSTNQISARSPTTQLGQQFSDQLKFAAEGALNDDDDNDKEQRQKGDNDSDKTSNGLISREQIYAEIVRECNELEKQQKTKKNTQHNQQQDEHHRREEEEEEQQNKIMMEVLKQSKNSELLLANKFLSCNDHLIARSDGRFSLDLEKLIKMVVAHVLKEMNGSNKTPISAVDGVPLPRKQKRLATQQQQFECESGTMHGENAAQILERKREQNNAAAARYRQRQKEQKDLLVKELCQLEQKNEKLKADIAKTQQEIEQEKAELWRRWHN